MKKSYSRFGLKGAQGSKGELGKSESGHWDMEHLNRQEACTNTWPEMELCPSESQKAGGSWDSSGQAPVAQYHQQHQIPLLGTPHLLR